MRAYVDLGAPCSDSALWNKRQIQLAATRNFDHGHKLIEDLVRLSYTKLRARFN